MNLLSMHDYKISVRKLYFLIDKIFIKKVFKDFIEKSALNILFIIYFVFISYLFRIYFVFISYYASRIYAAR